jgi:hypothetical protein
MVRKWSQGAGQPNGHHPGALIPPNVVNHVMMLCQRHKKPTKKRCLNYVQRRHGQPKVGLHDMCSNGDEDDNTEG